MTYDRILHISDWRKETKLIDFSRTNEALLHKISTYVPPRYPVVKETRGPREIYLVVYDS
uniref:Uncharacterized protein n=1 Tax=Arundo donax TaxID=35708 RepID=A0A0A9HQ19_ARUDO